MPFLLFAGLKEQTVGGAEKKKYVLDFLQSKGIAYETAAIYVMILQRLGG